MRAIVALLALVAALVTGGRAFAHAELVAADPPAGAVLANAPAAVVLTFSEPVRPIAIRWFPPHGSAFAAEPATEGPRVSVPLPAGADPGTYLLSWRVASADGHPVGGSHTFSIGAPTAAPAPQAARPPWGAAAGRGLLTLALVFGVGGTVFLRLVDRGGAPLLGAHRLALWSAGAVAPAPVASGYAVDRIGAPLPRARLARRSARATVPTVQVAAGCTVDRGGVPLPRASRLALWSAWAIVPAALVATGLHGLDMLDAPVRALLGLAPWAAALASPFAHSAAAAVFAAAAALAALRRPGPAGAAAALAAWVLAALSFALFGHAATAAPRWLTAPAVGLHAAAFLFWIGALPALAERAATDPSGLLPSLRRFSALALPLVGLLVLSGTALAALQIRDPDLFLATAYGRILVAKLLLVSPLLCLAALNRLRLTPAIARSEARAAGRFRRSVLAEIALGVAILAIASGFRLTPPPRTLLSVAPAGAVHAHLHGETVMANITLTPGRPGPNAVALAFAPENPAPLELRITFTDPARSVEPIRLAATPDGAAWRVGEVFLPHGGEWHATVDLLVSDFVKVRLDATFTLPDR